MFNRTFALMFAVLLLSAIGSVGAADSTVVGKYVISSGGGTTSNSEFKVKGTIGQPVIGLSVSNTYDVFSGFWPGFPLSCCIGIRGDLNSDGFDNTVLDLTFLINKIYRGGPDPVCLEEGDLDGNGTPSQVLDMTLLINKIFRGGPDPISCGSGL